MVVKEMSNLEELIEKLCPDGVEYKYLADAVTIKRGVRLIKKELKDNAKYPVYQNSLIPLGYYDDYNCEANKTMIITAGAAGDIVYSNTRFWAADDCFYFICNRYMDDKFLYYVLMSQQREIYSKVRKASIPRLPRIVIEKLKLPVPPLEVQREIVRILDNFTFLTTELAAELAARQKQYEYYRDLLLTFKPNESTILNERTNELELSGAIRWMKLGDICLHSCSGATPKKSNSEYYVGGTVPWIRTQNVTFNNIYSVDSFITEQAVQETAAKWIPENCVIVAISGASAGRCAINKIKATTNQHCLNMEIDSSKALYKYVFHCLCNQYEELLSKKQGARGDLNSSLILETMIPVPPLKQQQRIVDILDRFDTICNDITSGLPAEIEARQKQYEYYRDKLLTFKELKKEA